MANFGVHTRGAIGIYSFTTGFIPSPERKPRNDNEMQAWLLWLERHGFEDEAHRLLDRYCENKK